MKCDTYGCKNKRLRGRKLCATCKSKINRKNNPVVTTYHSLKASARRRGISFSITMEEWKRFCKMYDYIKLRGRGSECLTVDRIDSNPIIGYAYFNMRCVTQYENVTKGQEEKRRLEDQRARYIDPLEKQLMERSVKPVIDYSSDIPPF